MSCEHCNGPGEKTCCWARAKEIKQFQKHVFQKYVIETLFDLLISTVSVVTDLMTVSFYIKGNKWVLAILTIVPVILPTTVFTNVYMSDESRGYCTLPRNRRNMKHKSSDPEAENSDTNLEKNGSNGKRKKKKGHGITCGTQCTICKNCCSGFFNLIFHKDRNIRKRGARAIRNSFKRSLKYFFGTFVLRFIAWAWYLKALIFGYKAYRSPKKFMKIQPPDMHWSHDLLIRLDFLQAALENAPQCVVQLYALLTAPDEQRFLGVVTLVFSFLDFVRVAIAVFWDIQKGPVIAPAGCYGTLMWKVLNIFSWIFLYVGRSCALALVIVTSRGASTSVVVIGIVVHVVLFVKLFSSAKYGVAAEKVAVSVFISIFFLPELESTDFDTPILTQLYYAVTLLQNVFFIIPWNGLDADYCIDNSKKYPTTTTTPGSLFVSEPNDVIGVSDIYPRNQFKGEMGDCLIHPVMIVLTVPSCTILGVVLRMAASQQMSKLKSTLPTVEKTNKMEERVAGIYNRKWGKMSVKEMSTAFMRMLRKEVTQAQPNNYSYRPKDENERIAMVSEKFAAEFKASQTNIRKSFSLVILRPNSPIDECFNVSAKSPKTEDSKSDSPPYFSGYDNKLTSSIVKDTSRNRYLTVEAPNREHGLESTEEENGTQKDTEGTTQTNLVPQTYFTPAFQQNSRASLDDIFRTVDIQMVTIESPQGIHVLETSWI